PPRPRPTAVAAGARSTGRIAWAGLLGRVDRRAPYGRVPSMARMEDGSAEPAAGRSEELFERAARAIPGGVNSPVRAFGAVGGTPRFMVRGQGSRVVDVDGREYVDYVQDWGRLLFGHARPEIVGAATEDAANGTSNRTHTA